MGGVWDQAGHTLLLGDRGYGRSEEAGWEVLLIPNGVRWGARSWELGGLNSSPNPWLWDDPGTCLFLFFYFLGTCLFAWFL